VRIRCRVGRVTREFTRSNRCYLRPVRSKRSILGMKGSLRFRKYRSHKFFLSSLPLPQIYANRSGCYTFPTKMRGAQ
jgi:hypothetical protein